MGEASSPGSPPDGGGQMRHFSSGSSQAPQQYAWGGGQRAGSQSGRPDSAGRAALSYRPAPAVTSSAAVPVAFLDDKLPRSVPWGRVVVDEAQSTKNREAAQPRVSLLAFMQFADVGPALEKHVSRTLHFKGLHLQLLLPGLGQPLQARRRGLLPARLGPGSRPVPAVRIARAPSRAAPGGAGETAPGSAIVGPGAALARSFLARPSCRPTMPHSMNVVHVH